MTYAFELDGVIWGTGDTPEEARHEAIMNMQWFVSSEVVSNRHVKKLTNAALRQVQEYGGDHPPGVVCGKSLIQTRAEANKKKRGRK